MAQDAPARGAAEAEVVIVVFGDLRDPATARLQPLLKSMLAAHPTDVRQVFRHLPAQADAAYTSPHRALIAAGEQANFWGMHDLLLAMQDDLSERQITQAARALDLDLDRFERARSAESATEEIKIDRAFADRVGVRAAPAMLVNDRLITGVPSRGDLDALIRHSLESTALASGP